MKRITVSLDDETYRRVRARVASLETSVSAVVRRFLAQFAGVDADFDRPKRLQERTLASIGAFRATPRLTRKEQGAEVTVQSGYILSEEPATLRGADVAVVLARRSAEGEPGGWVRDAPDVAVEVREIFEG